MADDTTTDLTDLPEHLEDVESPGGAVADPVPAAGLIRFARMVGSSIAATDAAPWVTDFLNAAYYRRPVAERDVDDLRLAFAILTTYWYREADGRRLRITDLRAFHRAFGGHRFDTEHSHRGLLDRDQLLSGACSLLGEWFADAYADDERRGWGIAFPTPQEKAGYDHTKRMRLARVGDLTPESAPPEEQIWHTYAPVEMPSAEGVIAALTMPERWPDFASEIGRFTPLRPGGLPDQTFEIEVAALTDQGIPVFTRGYVTITKLVTPDDPKGLARWFDAVEEGLARYGEDEPRAVPEDGVPVIGFDLTTHRGHFMGNGHSRLMVYTHEDRVWVRAVGTWDPMSWHIAAAYRMVGEAAQRAFWGGAGERQSVLHQLAKRVAR